MQTHSCFWVNGNMYKSAYRSWTEKDRVSRIGSDKNRVGKINPQVQNTDKVEEAKNIPYSLTALRNCINKRIMYIKSDSNQEIGKTHFPKRWGEGWGGANDVK